MNGYPFSLCCIIIGHSSCVHPHQTQRPDVVIFSIRSPRTSRPLPRDRFFIPSRFLTVPGPVEGPRRPKIAKKLRLDFFEALEVWVRSRNVTKNRRRRPPEVLGGSSQTSSVVKRSGRRSFAVFRPRGPSTGPGTVKKRLGMKNRSRGKGPDIQGPTLRKNYNVGGEGGANNWPGCTPILSGFW